jgi:pyruvate,water dikinase
MLVRPIEALGAADLDVAGGKGANLGELKRAGLPVPAGFVLTTEAYRQAADAVQLNPQLSTDAAERLRTASIPRPIARAALKAYGALTTAAGGEAARTAGRGGGPTAPAERVAVAVRSSATAEDLPGASFAGQQDTYLNVRGEAELLDAIRRCWASLWNDRAVAYRRANAIDPSSVSLAVVVQAMVPATAAGVLFTADPLTGQRQCANIDAIADLGEKLVSGAANPDHYLVDTATHRIVERKLVGGRAVLGDSEIVELSVLGARVERHFGVPQDIEFALDASRRVWLVQSRPITTLYPLPAASKPDGLRVYISVNVFQGYFEPLTPMGLQFYRLLGTSIFRGAGADVTDAIRGPEVLVEAGMRLFIDITAIVRDRAGLRILESFVGVGEARSSVVLARLGQDPRLPARRGSRLTTVRRIATVFARLGVPRAAVPALLHPAEVSARYQRELQAITYVGLPPDASSTMRLDAFEWLLLQAAPRTLPRLLGIMAPAMLSLLLTHWLLRGVARGDEIQTLTRGAPNNPTVEMDLALWSLSLEVRSDATSRTALLEREPVELAAAYQAGTLPPPLQLGLAGFLAGYGFRSIGEIDIGVKRWSEDPTHILGALANYTRLNDLSLAPDAQLARGRRAAERLLGAILARVKGPRRLLVRLVVRRMRELIGAREAPKFNIIRLLATPSRQLLQPVGADLAAEGRVIAADDIFFLTLPEARAAVAGADVREIVARRRRVFERERARRHLPRVLLSDGTDAEAALVAGSTSAGGLHGSPASPGVVSGIARVIRSPVGARLEPGEILVAPSTDPGWTPLFLTAGGLVMEMGGMMSHGAVVAREYGIPAVVGVAGATERITTGQRLSVDGSAGVVSIEHG